MFIGTGSSIEFSSGFFAEVLDISGPSASREAIQSSHMLTTPAHTFDPAKLIDWGELTVEIAYIPSTTIPIKGAKETIIITYADSAGSTITFSGFMTGFEPSTPLEERSTASCTIKVDGDATQA